MNVSRQLSDPDILHVKKVDFVYIFAMVINCTVQMEKEFEKISIIVSLNAFWDFTAEVLQGTLSITVSPSQAPESL